MQIIRMASTLALVAVLLAACGGAPPAPDAAGSAPATAAPTTAEAIASVSATAAPTGVEATSTTTAAAPTGELRIGTGINLPSSLLVTEGASGYTLTMYGAAEMLMRFTPEQELVPWLAESVSRDEPTTWRIVLRRDVTFHDGTPMTADEVAASLRRSLDELAGAQNFLAPETTFAVVDDATLTLTTPTPQGNVPYSLANWNFAIHKPAVEGVSVLTGMYRPVRLEKDQALVLENYPGYWGGAAPLERISVRQIPDANARMLALQSGDLDMLTNVPPEIARSMPADIEQTSVPGTRMHYIILNHARPPFDDQRVREAAALGIDRDALLQATLDGQGVAATNLYPPSVGIAVVEAQRFDAARAAALLDEAGWRTGADGARAKDGQPLRFVLHSYPGRPELTQMALVVQAQLEALGFAVEVEEVADVMEPLDGGAFDASMFSVGVSNDPQYLPALTLAEGSEYNFGGYRSDALEQVLERLQTESDAATRAALAAEVQRIVQTDTPNIYLAVPPLNTAYRAGVVQGVTPHPSDLYMVTRELRKD
jgi:peptide/nickel transport system substrate-binding protein